MCSNEHSHPNKFSQSSSNKNFSNCRSNNNPTDGCQHKFLSSGPTGQMSHPNVCHRERCKTCRHNGAFQFWHLNKLGSVLHFPLSLNSSTSRQTIWTEHAIVFTGHVWTKPLSKCYSSWSRARVIGHDISSQNTTRPNNFSNLEFSKWRKCPTPLQRLSFFTCLLAIKIVTVVGPRYHLSIHFPRIWQLFLLLLRIFVNRTFVCTRRRRYCSVCIRVECIPDTRDQEVTFVHQDPQFSSISPTWEPNSTSFLPC